MGSGRGLCSTAVSNLRFVVQVQIMTRKKLNRLLAIVVSLLLSLIALALFAKLRDDNSALAKLYDFIKDTSLLIATVAVAYLANIYQKRQQFLQSLREQWREIVQAKAVLISYCDNEARTIEDYYSASRQLSECIDNMRIVYTNVGETDELIGLFPYAPLHHMRHALETVHPRICQPGSPQFAIARDQIWNAFNAIREHFLDEFDIEEPSKPILVHAMKRRKAPGSAAAAQRLHDKQEAVVKANRALEESNAT